MTNKDNIELTLVIPAFNEEARLPAFLEEARSYLASRYPGRHEILVVDDGSRDGTARVVESLLGGASLIRLAKNQGKGAAVARGMLAARGKLRLFADADGATPIAEEAKLAAAIESGNDIAIGSRAAPGGVRRLSLRAHPASPGDANAVWHVLPHRHLIGRVFSALVKRTLSLSFEDTQCGFKMFRADAAEAIFAVARSKRFAFDVEALYLARLFGLKVAEIPVNWHEVSGSKVRLGRDAWQMYQELRRMRRWHAELAAAPARRRKAG